jgi:cell pole-organizing protein PopZ
MSREWTSDMSDPVTNVEIEDVLSSIRRLVSDDTHIRPVAWGDSAAKDRTGELGALAASGSEVGRLVLTPALRVSDADADAPWAVLADNVDIDVAAQPHDVTSVYVLDASRDAAADLDVEYTDSLGAADVAQELADGAAAAQSEDVVFASTRDGGGRDGAFDAVVDPVDAPDDCSFLLAEDEAVLDEETLRELVAEIVRQELQGALGERITRNVRKLVRREIQRALTSNELE